MISNWVETAACGKLAVLWQYYMKVQLDRQVNFQQDLQGKSFFSANYPSINFLWRVTNSKTWL